ncbi:Reverse transcriptase domain-containing protein [Aphis craccivora]|uniref:Reverse transcriptase domain-containing protein n=1 Tax=Aphis craccivora TaxID=307492 RepID=A0A6G0W9H8_APHCR|nr:Reverse transcriptase domain-containing protein [Aphis craccivora]
MKINIKKTKVLVYSRYNSIRTSIKLKDGENIEQVEDFIIFRQHYKLRWEMQKRNYK